ncbi:MULTISPECIES: helix-turn-helix domain-containing protein [unclassified Streptomyces]|uniref:helix-turn-helix domain-containing protein n=1 Tax=unclassified Streptomyces TaxID=2593676 RepID=UPI0006AE2DC7|nr:MULTISPECIES: helix-turn-helix transcriptional regulator [unclassified Streptomyces]
MTEQQRGRRAIETGPTGQAVATNLARLRKARGLTTRQLSALLEQNGRPIPASGITRMEKKERQVTADDLAALAVVLGVSPSALLLPVDVELHDEVQITGSTPVTAYAAWQWADGKAPLSTLGQGVQGGRAYMRALMEYRLYGRPHWLIEMEDEQGDEYSRLVTAEAERQAGGPVGPASRPVPLGQFLEPLGLELAGEEDGKLVVRKKPDDGGRDG